MTLGDAKSVDYGPAQVPWNEHPNSKMIPEYLGKMIDSFIYLIELQKIKDPNLS